MNWASFVWIALFAVGALIFQAVSWFTKDRA